MATKEDIAKTNEPMTGEGTISEEKVLWLRVKFLSESDQVTVSEAT